MFHLHPVKRSEVFSDLFRYLYSPGARCIHSRSLDGYERCGKSLLLNGSKNACGNVNLYNGKLQRNIYLSAPRYFPKNEPRPRKVINITWYSVLGTILFSSGAFYIYTRLNKEEKLRTASYRISALAKAGLGQSCWSLTNQFGQRKSCDEFKGQWILLYFGFCHCPDICPEEIEKLVTVGKAIDADGSVPDIQPIFITLDPERDTVEYMNKYCKDFSDKLIGFTGSNDEIADVAKSYGVYYKKGEQDEDGDYIVDHTICIYLINPDGQLVDVYERRAKPDGIAKGCISHMKEYTGLKKLATT